MIFEMYPLLAAFCNVAVQDNRLGATHISLYVALLQQCHLAGGKNPFPIQREGVMKVAKISARFTYNKCLNNLKEFGYINYLPSTNSFTKSIVYLKVI